MRRTRFNPEQHAFRFPNRFKNEVDVGPFRIRTSGRCGGMAFAALDYYFAGIPVPEFTPADFPDGNVPPDGHPLADYIFGRQLDSMVGRDGWRFLRWTRRSTRTLLRATLENEIPKVKAAINRGMPVVLGLVRGTRVRDVNNNHQVVCYAYKDHPSGHTDLYIYDPNHPPGHSRHYRTGEVVLSRRIRPAGANDEHIGREVPGDVAEPIKTITTAGRPFRTEHAGTWRGFFVQRYSRRSNPPRFDRQPVRARRGSASEPGGPGVEQPPRHMK